MKERDPIACESCKVSVPASRGASPLIRFAAGAVVGLLVLVFLLWYFA